MTDVDDKGDDAVRAYESSIAEMYIAEEEHEELEATPKAIQTPAERDLLRVCAATIALRETVVAYRERTDHAAIEQARLVMRDTDALKKRIDEILADTDPKWILGILDELR